MLTCLLQSLYEFNMKGLKLLGLVAFVIQLNAQSVGSVGSDVITCIPDYQWVCKSSFPRKYPHSILTNNSGNLSQPNSLLNCSPFRVSLRYAWVTDTLVNAIYWSHGLQQSTWSTGYPQELTTSVHLCLMPTPVHAVVSHILW